MMEGEALITRVNEFLDYNVFEIPDPFNIGGWQNAELKVKVKVKIKETKRYIVVGEWKELLTYELTFLPTDGLMDGILNDYRFDNKKELELSTYEDKGFSPILLKVNELLENFLNYFGIDIGVICTKVINGIKY